MAQAIIFDLDGTLWDPTSAAVALWNGIFDKYSIPARMTREKVSRLMGKTMEEIGEALFPNLSETARRRILEDYGEREVTYLRTHGAVLYDGLADTLKLLQEQYELYIVSNSQDGYVPAFLQAHCLGQYFKDIEMSGRTGCNKGQNIRLIMQRNHCERAVYVGDTAGDEKAAREAGVPFIWAKYGFGTAESPDGVIDAITALPAYLLHAGLI